MLLRTLRTLIAAHLAAYPTALLAQERVDLVKVPLPAGLLAPEAATSVAARVALLEGPAFDELGNLFFSDIYASRIYRMTPEGKVTIFREESGRTNGNTFDAQGRLISCEGAEQGPGGADASSAPTSRRARSKSSPIAMKGNATTAPMTSSWTSEAAFGSPIRSTEMIARRWRWMPRPSTASTPTARSRACSRSRRSSGPTGSRSTSDGKTLYVVDSNGQPGGNRKVWAFDVSEDRTPAHRRQVFDFGRGRGGDGLRLDERGNLWVAAGIMYPRSAGETADVPPGVYVFTPKGDILGRISIPEDLCTNLAFGGPGRRTLFVTAGKSIYKVPLAVSGQALDPPTERHGPRRNRDDEATGLLGSGHAGADSQVRAPHNGGRST